MIHRRQTDCLEAGLWCSGHWTQCGVSRPPGQCGKAQWHQHPQHQGHWGAGRRGVCVPGEEMVASYHTEAISTLFPVSDLNTKWYSICAAHSERARYVQWIMRLWHDVTGRKRNTQPENGKGLNVQRKWISRNEKCLFSLFPEMECSTPWLNSLSSWVFTDAAVARQLISPLSLNSLIPWIKWDKLQFVLSELGNLSLLRTFDKTFNAKPWKMMESILYLVSHLYWPDKTYLYL